ncbi:unnamed protein product [Malus baccata var. baccata]
MLLSGPTCYSFQTFALPIPLVSSPSRWVKINVDGSFCSVVNLVGVGVVFHDEAGSYAGDFVLKLPHATNPRMVELMATRDGILWDDIKDGLRVFVESKVCHVRRSANVVAHCMAKFTLSSDFNSIGLRNLQIHYQRFFYKTLCFLDF